MKRDCRRFASFSESKSKLDERTHAETYAGLNKPFVPNVIDLISLFTDKYVKIYMRRLIECHSRCKGCTAPFSADSLEYRSVTFDEHGLVQKSKEEKIDFDVDRESDVGKGAFKSE